MQFFWYKGDSCAIPPALQYSNCFVVPNGKDPACQREGDLYWVINDSMAGKCPLKRIEAAFFPSVDYYMIANVVFLLERRNEVAVALYDLHVLGSNATYQPPPSRYEDMLFLQHRLLAWKRIHTPPKPPYNGTSKDVTPWVIGVANEAQRLLALVGRVPPPAPSRWRRDRESSRRSQLAS